MGHLWRFHVAEVLGFLTGDRIDQIAWKMHPSGLFMYPTWPDEEKSS